MADVMGQLMAAMNRHDPHGVAGVFAADYRSEQPLQGECPPATPSVGGQQHRKVLKRLGVA